jgi:predicted RecA/RadA family phage recombinase
MSESKKTPVRTIRPAKIVSRVKLGDNREVRITRIPTGTSDDYIRIGINLIPTGQNMSGAVFPASYLDEVIAALRKAAA